MTEPKTTSIRIEPLNPSHLAQWVQDAPLGQLSRFQGFLIGEWLGETLQSLGANITRQSLVKALKATSPVNQDDNSVDLVFLGSGPWEP